MPIEYALPITLLVVLTLLTSALWIGYFRRERFYDFCEKTVAEVEWRTMLDEASGLYTDRRWKSKELEKLIQSDTEAEIKFWRSFESFIPDRLWFYLYGSKN